MPRLYVTVAAAALAAVLGFTTYTVTANRASDAFADCRSGYVAGGAIGGPFQLVDDTGNSVTDAQALAKPALVYFGFTSCADVCPLDNARNVEATDLLAKNGLDVIPVFITVDPARDTPAVMADYTSSFGDTLLGLTGSMDQIKAATSAYKVFFQIPDSSAPNYQVDHTVLTYLVLPNVGVVDFFSRDATAQDLADHTGCFLRAS